MYLGGKKIIFQLRLHFIYLKGVSKAKADCLEYLQVFHRVPGAKKSVFTKDC